MNRMRHGLECGMILLGMLVSPVYGQVAVDVSKYGVTIQSANEHSGQSSSGSITADVQMEGVAVINGDVFIDGERVPKGKTSFTAKKSRKTYSIQWGKNGNVSVSEK